jgi:hypothetical protein
MSEQVSPAQHDGPPVADTEDLYRGITTNDWWVPEGNRPSSAAFRFPDFSSDVVSLAGSPEFTLAHLPAGSGIAQFNSGVARALGFDARLEADPEQPENHAHANVYCLLESKQRKKAAQKLAQDHCTLTRKPSFAA